MPVCFTPMWDNAERDSRCRQVADVVKWMFHRNLLAISGLRRCEAVKDVQVKVEYGRCETWVRVRSGGECDGARPGRRSSCRKGIKKVWCAFARQTFNSLELLG